MSTPVPLSNRPATHHLTGLSTRGPLSCVRLWWHWASYGSLCASSSASLISLVYRGGMAGKTTLLVALVVFLRQGAPAPPAGRQVASRRHRILVVAHTNAAVDRIILGLAAAGFTGTPVSPSSLLSARAVLLVILSFDHQ